MPLRLPHSCRSLRPSNFGAKLIELEGLPQVSTIRCRLLKVSTLVTIRVRRIVAAPSSAIPLQRMFAQALANLQRACPLRP